MRKGYTKVPNSIYAEMQGLGTAEKLLYMIILSYENNGSAWPSQATLATDFGCQRNNINVILRGLIKAKFIERIPGAIGKNTTYAIVSNIIHVSDPILVSDPIHTSIQNDTLLHSDEYSTSTNTITNIEQPKKATQKRAKKAKKKPAPKAPAATDIDGFYLSSSGLRNYWAMKFEAEHGIEIPYQVKQGSLAKNIWKVLPGDTDTEKLAKARQCIDYAFERKLFPFDKGEPIGLENIMGSIVSLLGSSGNTEEQRAIEREKRIAIARAKQKKDSERTFEL